MEAPNKLIAVLIVVGLVFQYAFQYLSFLQTLIPAAIGNWIPTILYVVSAVWLFIGY